MNTETIESVRVEVEPTHLIKGLQHAFTGKINVAAELLSNARRASASRVIITVTDRVFTIDDDGIGVHNFNDLIKIGGTAWDSFIHEVETPYGCGFLSSLFGAKHIRVESRGRVLDCDTATLLAQEAVDIQHDDGLGQGTRIILSDHQLAMTHHQWEELCSGFPIPVVVNGTELGRRYAVDHISCIETPIGLLNHHPVRGIDGTPRLYLQGFEVSRTRRHSEYAGVLHLDARQFLGRFPDRAQLWQEQEAFDRISVALKSLQTEFLSTKKKELGAAAFVSTYAELCIYNGDVAMLNDIAMIPTNWVSTLSPSDLLLPQEWDTVGSPFDQSTSLDIDRLAAGFCVDSVITDASDYEDECSFLPAAFAVAKGLPCVSNHWFSRLDNEHPLRSMHVDLSGVTIDIREEVGRALLCLDSDYVVVACKSFVLRHDSLGEAEISDFAVYTGERGSSGEGGSQQENGLLVSPIGDSQVIRQTTRCLVEDRYDEIEEDNYRNTYLNAYAVASSASLVAQLQQRINQTLSLPKQFDGTQFLLTVDSRGNVVISEPSQA